MGSQIESLLEKLVSINASMLQRLDVLVEEIKEIKNHFDFTDEKSASHHLIESVRELNSHLDPETDHSFAHRLLNELDFTNKLGATSQIVEAAENIENLISNELNWTRDLSFAKTIIDAINGTTAAIEDQSP